MHQSSFGDPKIDLYLVLLRGRFSRLKKLILECFDFLFKKNDVFAQGSLHRFPVLISSEADFLVTAV
jgi:hypothetical protein